MDKARIIIAGGRDFRNYLYLHNSCLEAIREWGLDLEFLEFVSGGQVTWDSKIQSKYGADYFGEKFAGHFGYKPTVFKADWNSLGKKAGPLRNLKMAEYAEYLICFWDGESRGTKSMIDYARLSGLKIRIFFYRNQPAGNSFISSPSDLV